MQEIVLCQEMVNVCKSKNQDGTKMVHDDNFYSKRLFKDFIYTYTHMHLYAYTHSHTKSIYAHVCMYTYRRNQFQTRIGRELGEKLSQVKKAEKERWFPTRVG